MSKVIVLGGGLSGLSCSTFLVENGIDVHLLEASPKLGGRAYSFVDNNTKDTIDNGQHIMMGCYESTFELLDLIGSRNKVDIQENLRVVFVDQSGSQHKLDTGSSLYPLNLSKALLSYTALTVKERFKVVDLFLDLVCSVEEDLIDTTVLQWLKDEGQDEIAIKSLWEILAIGTLNSKIDKASAAVFVNILKQMFLDGNDSTKIVIPNSGLSEVFDLPATQLIIKSGGQVSISEKVESIEIENNRITKVNTTSTSYNEFDFVVSALPIHALDKIGGFPDVSKISKSFSYSPIISVNIWLSENNFTEKFYGIIDSPIHWLFNHNKYITLITSAADDLIEKSDKELIDLITIELSNIFPVFSQDLILCYKIIKEKRATFVPTAESIKAREEFTVDLQNLIVCGDWTEPLLPATIETAVLSGKKAAEKIVITKL